MAVPCRAVLLRMAMALMLRPVLSVLCERRPRVQRLSSLARREAASLTD